MDKAVAEKELAITLKRSVIRLLSCMVRHQGADCWH